MAQTDRTSGGIFRRIGRWLCWCRRECKETPGSALKMSHRLLCKAISDEQAMKARMESVTLRCFLLFILATLFTACLVYLRVREWDAWLPIGTFHWLGAISVFWLLLAFYFYFNRWRYKSNLGKLHTLISELRSDKEKQIDVMLEQDGVSDFFMYAIEWMVEYKKDPSSCAPHPSLESILKEVEEKKRVTISVGQRGQQRPVQLSSSPAISRRIPFSTPLSTPSLQGPGSPSTTVQLPMSGARRSLAFSPALPPPSSSLSERSGGSEGSESSMRGDENERRSESEGRSEEGMERIEVGGGEGRRRESGGVEGAVYLVEHVELPQKESIGSKLLAWLVEDDRFVLTCCHCGLQQGRVGKAEYENYTFRCEGCDAFHTRAKGVPNVVLGSSDEVERKKRAEKKVEVEVEEEERKEEEEGEGRGGDRENTENREENKKEEEERKKVEEEEKEKDNRGSADGANRKEREGGEKQNSEEGESSNERVEEKKEGMRIRSTQV